MAELSLSERIRQRSQQMQTDAGTTPSAPAPTLSQKMQQRREQIMQQDFPEARTLTPPPPDQQKDISIGEMARQAWKSAPRSAYEAGEAFVHPFLHPVETAQNIGALGKGAYSKLAGYAGVEQDPRKKEMDEAAINAVRDFYANRYGSWRGFKQAVAQDPFGVALDASIPLTLGETALARAPGVLGTVGRVAGKAATITDPMRAIPAATKGIYKATTKIPKVGSFVESAVDTVTGLPAAAWEKRAGVMPGTLKTAYQAGKTGAPEYAPFVEQMRSQAPRTDVVNMINDALEAEKQANIQNFMQTRQAILANQAPADYTRIDRALSDARSSIQHGGISGQYAHAETALDDIGGIIDQYKSGNLNSLEDLDKLRTTVNEKLDMYGGNAKAKQVLMQVKDAIKGTIGARSQEYLDLLDDAEKSMDAMKAFRFAVGNPGAIPEKQLQKIIGSLKNKDKKNILDKIIQMNPEIDAALKGMSASAKGQASLTDLILYGLGYATSGHLAGAGLAAAGLASESPRLLGELGYRTGVGVRKVAPIVEKAAPLSPFMQELGKLEQRKERDRQKKEFLKLQSTGARPTSGLPGETDDERYARLVREGQLPPGTLPVTVGRPTRATGGRIGNAIMKADSLIRDAERAKKNLGKQTEDMLELPDEHITKALAVAKAHI